MTKKKPPAQGRREVSRRRRPRRLASGALSAMAAMILGCKDDRASLPILADWLEEKLGLAALLRSPNVAPVAAEPRDSAEFAYYPLAEDAFLWLVQCYDDPEAR
jgi:hypothetical protein